MSEKKHKKKHKILQVTAAQYRNPWADIAVNSYDSIPVENNIISVTQQYVALLAYTYTADFQFGNLQHFSSLGHVQGE